MAGPSFILATDLGPTDAAWNLMEATSDSLHEFASRTLGVETQMRIARLPARSVDDAGEFQIGRIIDQSFIDGASTVFVLPTAFDLNVWQRALLGEELTVARRRHAAASIHHDTVDPTHPLLVDCFSAQILKALEERRVPPQQAGVLLVADGQGDPSTRADSYRLMRLLWEQTSLRLGDVGFVRHAQPFLREALERCLREPIEWLLLPQRQWDGEPSSYAQVMLDDHRRAHPEARGWSLLPPPGDHPAIQAWLEQRLLRLWREKRANEAARVPSARYQPPPRPAAVWSGEDWVPVGDAVIPPRTACVGRTREPEPLAQILSQILPPSDHYLVKVTWHGYAQGTYTGPAALDLLLSALPGRAIILEGHTSSRNVGGADFDWEVDADQHRAWIRQQDVEFLRRTGLAEVLARHDAQYLNITEAWWDGACAAPEEVQQGLGDVSLRNPDLAGFVPSALLELRGSPFISFARFKGPTRLGVSNLFGLIPHPLRTKWHGEGIMDFAGACCDMALLYGSLFPMFGLVEAFDSAVRWDRKGLYRSRWGNYDLVLTDGLFTLSEGLVAADLLASRLQGQDVKRSAFYHDVIRNRLGWSPEEVIVPLPADLSADFA